MPNATAFSGGHIPRAVAKQGTEKLSISGFPLLFLIRLDLAIVAVEPGRSGEPGEYRVCSITLIMDVKTCQVALTTMRYHAMALSSSFFVTSIYRAALSSNLMTRDTRSAYPAFGRATHKSTDVQL